MRRIIAIGECVLDVEFHNGAPVKSYAGGRILNAAAMLGKAGYNVDFIGECGRDRIGDIIIDFLESNNVSTRSIDRYTEGVTPSAFVFNDAETVYNEKFPTQEFDFIWPSVSDKDIVIFGSFFSVSQRVRDKVYELLQYASERKAVLIYLPGFAPQKSPNVTKQMPAIFENLELADIVVSRTGDLSHIFGNEDDSQVYSHNISFYCNNFINVNHDGQIKHYNNGCHSIKTTPGDNRLLYDAETIAKITKSIIDGDIYHNNLDQFSLTI